MRTRILSLLLPLALACGKSDPVTTPPPPPPPPPSPAILASGADMSGGVQNIYVSRSGAPLTSATVTVNGIRMTHAGSGLYQGTISPVVATGGDVTLIVGESEQTLTAHGIVPDLPTINDPAATPRGTPLVVTWTDITSPDSFSVSLNYTMDGIGYGVTQRIGGTLRTATIPTADVPAAAAGLSLDVFGFNIGTFSGDFATGSNMHLRHVNAAKPFSFSGP